MSKKGRLLLVHYDSATFSCNRLIPGVTVSAAEVSFAESKWNAAVDKLEAIGIQKWINYGILQPAHAWAEIRRTGYPKLSFPDDNAAQTIKQVPNRFRYPKSEVDLNTENYNVYKSKDNWTDKMFWAK